MYHRYRILVCPLCGDLECGFISVSVDNQSDTVEWSNFYLENRNEKLDIGPFFLAGITTKMQCDPANGTLYLNGCRVAAVYTLTDRIA